MFKTPEEIWALAGVISAIGFAVASVFWAVSRIVRAQTPQEPPKATIETLGEAMRTLGHTNDLLAQALRSAVTAQPAEAPLNAPISTPVEVVIEKALAILRTTPRERTSENYAFLERYITPVLLTTIFKMKEATHDDIEAFATDRRTPPETRNHLLTTLLEARPTTTEQPLPTPSLPPRKQRPQNPEAAIGRHSVDAITATGEMPRIPHCQPATAQPAV